jgi:hypothetical protein
MEDTMQFPNGTYAGSPMQHDACADEGEDAPYHTIDLFPAGFDMAENLKRDWLANNGHCEFSTGNSWPDTDDMREYIVERLTNGWPVTLQFKTAEDCAECHRLLLRSAGVTYGPPKVEASS